MTLLARLGQDWKIVCLVRAQDDTSAQQRVLANLENQHLHLSKTQTARLSYLSAKIPEIDLAIPPETYRDLASSVKLVIHAAWPVHFSAGLQSFVPHLQGLRNLIDLARGNKAKFFFCSSTAAVLASPSSRVEERIYTDAKDAVAMGYARSKFVAESICAAAWKRDGRGQIGVLRLGQLSGDTKHGIWKTEEGWPQLFASSGVVQRLPDLQEVGLRYFVMRCSVTDFKVFSPDPELATHGQSSRSHHRYSPVGAG